MTPFQTFNDTLADRPVELNALLVEGEPWFKGTDVAAALKYSNVQKTVRTHVDDQDKEKLNNLWVPISGTLQDHKEGAQITIYK